MLKNKQPDKTVSDSRVDSCGSDPLLLKDRAAVKDTELSGPGGLKTELRTKTKSHIFFCLMAQCLQVLDPNEDSLQKHKQHFFF